MNELQAYKVMLIFLENYYNNTKSDEIAILLGSMSLTESGKPMDPGVWQDWINAIKSLNEGQKTY